MSDSPSALSPSADLPVLSPPRPLPDFPLSCKQYRSLFLPSLCEARCKKQDARCNPASEGGNAGGQDVVGTAPHPSASRPHHAQVDRGPSTSGVESLPPTGNRYSGLCTILCTTCSYLWETFKILSFAAL